MALASISARVRRHLLLVALAASGSISARARADETPSLALAPAPAGEPTLLTEPAQVRGDAQLRARLLGVFASQPLVLKNQDQEIDRVVESQLWLHTLLSFAFRHRYQLSLDVPVLLSQTAGQTPPHGTTAARPREETLLGDVRLGARTKLWGPAGAGEHLALAAGASLPTGRDYAGDGGFGGRMALLADGQYARWFWAADAGVRLRPEMRLPGIVPTRVGNELTASVAHATFVDGAERVSVGSELSAAFTLGGGARLLDPHATRAHFLIVGRFRPFTELDLGVAFGPDLGQAPGAADFRALAFLGFTPEQTPPPPDRDDDGVPDRLDACIDLPGAPAQDPLMNGCPEVPPDFDADEIPDQFDACPREAGPATGDRRSNGCPRPVDTDGDGIVDQKDACPKEKGVPNTNREQHGCPPAPPPPPPVAQVEAEQVAISEQVQFEHGTAVLRAESDGILSEVAKVLAEHPELEQIEVAGYTDDTGTPAVNQKLSAERAASVMKWLVGHGTATARLSAKGYGQTSPLADNSTEAGRAKNRRVEFHILRRSEKEPTP